MATDPLYSQRAGFHSSQGSHYDDGRNSGASYPVRSSPRLPHLYPPTVPTAPSPEQLQTLVIEGSQQLAYPSVSVHSSPAYEPAPAPGLLRAVLRDTLSVGSTAMHRPRSPNSRPGMGDALLSDIGVIQRLHGPRMDYPTEERAEPWGRPPEYPTPVLSAYPTPDRMRNAQQAVSPPADPETQSASRPSPEKDLPSVVRSDTPSRDGVAVMREATSSWLQAEIGKALEEKKRIREEASVSTADTVRRETEGLLPSLFSIDVANAALAGVMIECKNPVRSLALGTTTTFNLSGIDNDVYQVFFSGHTSSARDIIVEVWNSAGLPYGPNTQALCSELGTSELKFFIVGKLKEVLLPKLIYFCPATIGKATRQATKFMNLFPELM
ncbi:hypothetical protein CSUI_005721 [Cystoisospora suis]|uniref:Uncharacterized protein n=1 Tax=Cystoisospora suis TaxID=483139 RepID=A0A2C6KX00_9APIC|nr:hypothetical protein CSUI_005721 [Cystoisospora suis]